MSQDQAAPATASTIENPGDPVADNPNPEIAIAAPPPPVQTVVEVVEAPPRENPPNPRDEKLKRLAEQRRTERGFDEPAVPAEAPAPRPIADELAAPPPELGSPEPAAPPQAPDPAPEPGKRFVVKVRQEERQLSEAELIAAAQKALAADSYFEDGKRFYDEAKAAREQLSRSAPGTLPHQEGSAQQTPPSDPSQPAMPPAEPHQADADLQKLVHDIQFGEDPQETATRLDTLLTSRADKAAERKIIERAMEADFHQTMEEFASLKDQKKDLFADPNAEAVMQRMLATAYAEDLRKIGVPDDRIPQSTGDRADWHRYYRVKGQKVRSSKDLIGSVVRGYEQWRGVQPTPAPAPAATPTHAAVPPQPHQTPAPQSLPRVVINRDDRRQAIPQQPTRSGTPPQQAPNETAARSPREATLAKMRAARGM